MDKRIAFLREQMLSSLQHEWTTEEMAQAVNLSTSQVQKLFKDYTGTSPIQYLRQLRLEAACELLKNSFKQIKEIRSKVGMPDAAHFSHNFKAKYGVTPSEYRKKIWEKTQAQGEN